MAVREVYGRTVQATEEPYFLPADTEEFQRLDAQHRLITAQMNGLYAAPEQVERILAPRANGSRPMILDVGTGSGIWAIEMAERFPHSNVVGIDLIPVLPNKPVPLNCQFDIGNVNHGLSQYPEGFDVIHFRFVGFGMTPWADVLQHATAALQPGGIILIIVPNGMKLYDKDMRPVELKSEGEPNCSYLFLFMKKAEAGISARSPGVGDTTNSDNILRDMKTFSHIETELLAMPLGVRNPSWSPKERFIGEIQTITMKKLLRAWIPVLHDQGYSSETVDRWLSKAEEEIAGSSAWHFTECFSMWAIKET